MVAKSLAMVHDSHLVSLVTRSDSWWRLTCAGPAPVHSGEGRRSPWSYNPSVAAEERGTGGGSPWDVAVVGGGAAGLVAAVFAARNGARIVLLEGSKDPGRKILVSGGGRCNVLPARFDEDAFWTSGSRHVLRRLFRTWRLDAVRAFFEEELGLPLVEEEESGKLFPAVQRARPVRDRLVEEAAAAGATLLCPWRVATIRREEEGFLLATGAGATLRARRVVLATGGCSLPATGSDGHGYELARALGHRILPLHPALVPLTTRDPAFPALAGLSLPVRWRTRRDGRTTEAGTGGLLVTHRGFSGPAVLDASHRVVRDGDTLEVAWCALTPGEWEEHWQPRGRRRLVRALADLLPRRLAELLVPRAGLRPDTRIGNLTRTTRDHLLAVLCAFPLPVDGHEGFETAEVTGGGIPLEELRPSTLESRPCPGLFPCGEILDVIGRIGGHNFLWAWVTGRLAGESAARQP